MRKKKKYKNLHSFFSSFFSLFLFLFFFVSFLLSLLPPTYPPPPPPPCHQPLSSYSGRGRRRGGLLDIKAVLCSQARGRRRGGIPYTQYSGSNRILIIESVRLVSITMPYFTSFFFLLLFFHFFLLPVFFFIFRKMSRVPTLDCTTNSFLYRIFYRPKL